MQNNRRNNFTLKLAVTAALSAYALSLPSSAFALGLGNIDVKSHLGQPLRATIKVLGASELKGDGCFKLINDANLENALTSAHFKLSNIVNDEAILTVSTSQIISEPITSMALMAECDANIRRDYALLLDPAPTVETKNSVDEESTIMGDAPLKNNSSSVVATEKAAPQTIQAVKSSKKTVKAKKNNANKSNKNIVLTTGFNAENAAVNKSTPEAEPKALKKNSTPRLSISSGDMLISTSLENPNLLLDKQLHLSPETSPEAYAPEIAVQDEVTVMNNRLAHLQKQISTLQERNAALETENKLKAQLTEKEKTSSNNWQWLSYLAGAGLLAGAYFATSWWRRRRLDAAFNSNDFASIDNAPFDNEHDDFFDFDKHQALNAQLEDTSQHFDLSEEQISNNASKAGSDEPLDTFSSNSATPFSVEEFNEDQNILDHADVFLSHGRTSLAIQLLQNHLLDHPKQSVTIWLFLLELLARENLQAIYEQTTVECKEHFNIRIPNFSNDEASEKKSFEDFPRLHDALQEIWGTPAAIVFLDDLIYNSRLENRIGFEKTVIEELLLLKNIANETLNTAEVIQMDEKKLALLERKEAQIAAKKEQKLKQMEELSFLEDQSKHLETNAEDSAFEFNLVEYN